MLLSRARLCVGTGLSVCRTEKLGLSPQNLCRIQVYIGGSAPGNRALITIGSNSMYMVVVVVYNMYVRNVGIYSVGQDSICIFAPSPIYARCSSTGHNQTATKHTLFSFYQVIAMLFIFNEKHSV